MKMKLSVPRVVAGVASVWFFAVFVVAPLCLLEQGFLSIGPIAMIMVVPVMLLYFGVVGFHLSALAWYSATGAPPRWWSRLQED